MARSIGARSLNVLDGVQGEDVALVDNRLATSSHFVARQAELGGVGFAVHDAIIAQVLDRVGADPYEDRAACAAFESLLNGESPFRYEP